MTAPSSVRAHISSAPPWPVVYLPLCFAVTAWGGSFVAARIVLYASSAGQAVLTPTVLATVRFGLPSSVFFPPFFPAILPPPVPPANHLPIVLPRPPFT